MAIKGHTTIELTNQVTGEKRVVEDDNLVTDYFARLFEKGSWICDTMFTYYSQNSRYNTDATYGYIQEFTRGLLLFDRALPENKTTYMVPKGVSMTGMASDFAYTGKNTMAGSYNADESGPIENGYKHVWDFSTNQSNGDIACACLTSRAGGVIGTGCEINAPDYRNKYHTSFYNSQRNRSFECPDTPSGAAPHLTYYTFHDYDEAQGTFKMINSDAFYYEPKSADSKYSNSMFVRKALDILTYRFPCSDISLFDKPSTLSLKDYISSETIAMPQNLAELYNDCTGCFSNGFFVDDIARKIYIVFTINSTYKNYINESENIYIWEIDMDTHASVGYIVPNATGSPFAFRYDSYLRGAYCRVVIFDGHLVVQKVTTNSSVPLGFYAINISNPTDIKTIKTVTDEDYTFDVFDNYSTPLLLDNCLCLLGYGYNSDTNTVCIERDTWRIKYMNANIRYIFDISNNCVAVITKNRDKLYGILPLNKSSISFTKSTLPAPLMTINNLTSPVTKTAADTMKVTYTLIKE